MSTSSTTPLAGIDLPEPGTYAIDPTHSTLVVVARHLMVAKVRGYFTELDGTVTVADDPLASSVEVTVKASSIDTRDEQRDAHLASADFLDVENHPDIRFRSTGLEHAGGTSFRLSGELTIRGVTRPVVADLEYLGRTGDPWGGTRIAFEARGEIDREEFGVTWNAALETGGVVVGKKLTFEFDVEAVKQ
ncbi:MAG TPA: YceI family protein [Acidimicrobiales bacterium]|nr:YceI family protein [Acidimicrobiales bacterium]